MERRFKVKTKENTPLEEFLEKIHELLSLSDAALGQRILLARGKDGLLEDALILWYKNIKKTPNGEYTYTNKMNLYKGVVRYNPTDGNMISYNRPDTQRLLSSLASLLLQEYSRIPVDASGKPDFYTRVGRKVSFSEFLGKQAKKKLESIYVKYSKKKPRIIDWETFGDIPSDLIKKDEILSYITGTEFYSEQRMKDLERVTSLYKQGGQVFRRTMRDAIDEMFDLIDAQSKRGE